MELLLAVAIIVAFGLLLAGVIVATSGVQLQTRRTVIVNTRDDQALKGVLVRGYRDSVELSGVSALAPDGATPVPGRVLVPRANVSTIQLPEA